MKKITMRNPVPVGVGKQAGAEPKLGDELSVADLVIGADTENHALQAVVFVLQVAEPRSPGTRGISFHGIFCEAAGSRIASVMFLSSDISPYLGERRFDCLFRFGRSPGI